MTAKNPDGQTAMSLDACRKAISLIYLKHDANKEAREVLDNQLRHGKRMREGTTGYIIGHSRCGKTETIARFIEKTTGKPFRRKRGGDAEPDPEAEEQMRLLAELGLDRYPPMYMRKIEGRGTRILYADMTSGITPLIASKLILGGIFGWPKVNALREPEAGNMLGWLLAQHRFDLFAIDEAQQMFRNLGPHAMGKFMKWLLALENAGAFAIVVAGAPALDRMFVQDDGDATNERIGFRAPLMPLAYKTEEDRERFAKIVGEFGRLTPFASTPLGDKALMPAFFYATRGRIGALAKLAETAALFAFERHKAEGAPGTLTIEDFKTAFDLSRIRDWRMNGINPFRDRPLPPIPLCIEDEEKDRQKLVEALHDKQRKKSGCGKGSRIY
ncbi:MAG: AAA family ATPase [Terracidiphilus sp.]